MKAPTTIFEFYTKLMATNSRNAKIDVIKQYSANPEVTEFLKIMYDTRLTFGVTADAVAKWEASHYNIHTDDLLTTLKKFTTREYSGHEALGVAGGLLFDATRYKMRPFMLAVLDKDLKAGIDAKTINTAIPGLVPTFDVALAFDFNKSKKSAELVAKIPYVIMRKLDGVRLITVINGCDDIHFYSRTGNEFTSLNVLRHNLKMYFTPYDRFVLDGELCVIENGMENFKLAVSQISHKREQMMSPFYKIFDMMTVDQFFNGAPTEAYSNRLLNARDWFNIAARMKGMKDEVRKFDILDFVPYANTENLLSMQTYADAHGWEGLILRADVPYRSGRTTDLLKVKNFKSEEFVIEDVVPTNKLMQGIDGKMSPVLCMGAVVVRYKGGVVMVGSGFNDAQRIDILKNKDKYIGRVITVKYFEETTDVNGKPSLRFPIFVGFRDGSQAI